MLFWLSSLTSHRAAKPFTGTCELPLMLLKSTIGTINTRWSVAVWLANVPPGSEFCPAVMRKLKELLIGPTDKPVSVVTKSPVAIDPGSRTRYSVGDCWHHSLPTQADPRCRATP